MTARGEQPGAPEPSIDEAIFAAHEAARNITQPKPQSLGAASALEMGVEVPRVSEKPDDEQSALEQMIDQQHDELLANYDQLSPEDRQKSLGQRNELLVRGGSRPLDEETFQQALPLSTKKNSQPQTVPVGTAAGRKTPRRGETPAMYQGESTMLWGQTRPNVELLEVAAQAAVDQLTGKEDRVSQLKLAQAQNDLRHAQEMLARFDAAKTSIPPKLQSLGAANPDDLAAKPDVGEPAPELTPAPVQPHPAGLEMVPEVVAGLQEPLAELKRRRAGQSVQVEVAEPAAQTAESSPESQPETEAEHTTVEMGELADARRAFGAAVESQGKFFGQAKPEVLAAAREKYQTLAAQRFAHDIEAVKKSFAGRDLNNPDQQVAYAAALVEVTILCRMEEERLLRNDMCETSHHRTMDKFRTFWKKTTLARFGTGVGLHAAEGAATVLAGPLGLVTVKTLKGVLSGTGTFLMTEAALHAVATEQGETKGRSDTEIEALIEKPKQSPDGKWQLADLHRLRELAAAHTMLQVRENGTETGVRQAGLPLMKKRDDTGARIIDALGRMERENLEILIREAVEGGQSIDDVAAMAVEQSIGAQTLLHNRYLERIKKNKTTDKKIFITAVGAGLLSGAASAVGLPGFGHAKPSIPQGAAVAVSGAKSAAHHGGSILDQGPVGAIADTASSHVAVAADVTRTHAGTAVDLSHAQHAAADTSHVGSGVSHHLQPEHKSWGDLRAEDDTAMHTKSWGELRMEDDAAYQAAQKAAHELGQHLYTAKPGESVWKLAEHFVADHYPNLSHEQQTWMVDSMKDKIVAHPEMVGLKGTLKVGQSVDFTKLGVDYRSLAEKALHLSKAATTSIHENLVHHAATGVDHIAAATGHAVTSGQPTPMHLAGPAQEVVTNVPRRLADLPVMVQDAHGNLVDLNQHLPTPDMTDVAHVASHVEGQWWNPEIAGAFTKFQDAREVWSSEAPAGAFMKWRELIGHLPTADAMKPGVLEESFNQIGTHDTIIQAKMAEALRQAVKALPLQSSTGMPKFGDLLTKIWLANPDSMK